MKIIGVIGKAGTGKSTLLDKLLLEVDSCSIWKIDDLVNYLYKKDKFFQTLILYLCGSLDKDKVRKILFKDSKKMALVEKYVETKIQEEIDDENLTYDYFFIEGTNLNKLNVDVDFWIEVTCEENERVKRLVERNGHKKALELIDFQKHLVYNMKNKLVVDTGQDLDSILTTIKKVLDDLE